MNFLRTPYTDILRFALKNTKLRIVVRLFDFILGITNSFGLAFFLSTLRNVLPGNLKSNPLFGEEDNVNMVDLSQMFLPK
jgi:hypothetical protein